MSAKRIDVPDFDVAVVGYGPTGATLANLLCLCGLSVLVLEREASAYHLPRAVHFDDEVMRVFQTVGIAEMLAQRVRVNPGMRFVDPNGALLLDWPRPQDVGPHGWHASYRFHQPDLEALLRQALEASPAATVRQQCLVVQLEEHESAVTIHYRDLPTATIQTATARYVVGCDGARSFVRQLVGDTMEDFGFCERWLVVDVLLKSDKPELGDHSVQFCDPIRPMTYCRSPGNRRRWEITVLAHEDSRDISTPERVWRFLSKWITPADAELERHAVYTFESAVVSSWRRGRLLLAGDAAHLTPPFMGQGMCAGIRDASNLGWKLAAAIRSNKQDILESYGSERLPHVSEYIKTAIKLGGLINSLDRDSALQMAASGDEGRPTLSSISPALGRGIGSSLEPRLRRHRGHLFPQPRLSDGTLLDDRCGYRHVILSTTRPPVKTSPNGSVYLSALEEPSLLDALESLDAAGVWIRPDRHILATAPSKEDIPLLVDAGRKLTCADS